MNATAVITLKDFITKCEKFDWQWYWRDTASVVPQSNLLHEAEGLGEEFIKVYEHFRFTNKNPYCPPKIWRME